MLSIIDQEILAEKIVQQAKSTSHVDTGALKRSISFTFIKGVLTFRELYYGQWNNNSRLEDLAEDLIPKDTPWGVQYTTFTGEEYVYTVKRSGRKLTRGTKPTRGAKSASATGKSNSSTTARLRNLINLVNENKKRAAEKNKK